MSTIANKDIRDAAKRANVFLWEIADKLSIQDSVFHASSAKNCLLRRRRRF